MEKKYCPIHHLYYTGYHCPLCLQEKSAEMSKKYYHEPVKVEKKVEDSKEATEEDLLALVAKFNNR